MLLQYCIRPRVIIRGDTVPTVHKTEPCPGSHGWSTAQLVLAQGLLKVTLLFWPSHPSHFEWSEALEKKRHCGKGAEVNWSSGWLHKLNLIFTIVCLTQNQLSHASNSNSKSHVLGEYPGNPFFGAECSNLALRWHHLFVFSLPFSGSDAQITGFQVRRPGVDLTGRAFRVETRSDFCSLCSSRGNKGK